jgi:1-pyrroline-5-carboxylate dehydrogenase
VGAWGKKLPDQDARMRMCAQVLTEYTDEQLPLVLAATEKLDAHLTAAVVSNDPLFTQQARFNSSC